MAIFKCKMCGGTIEFNEGDTIGVCDSCGTKQTLPRLDSDRKTNLYDRANHFRRNNEFDKAMSIYENILNEDQSDAEAYWSIVLCRYGIEYVEDPATHRRVPTVNRAQFTSIFDDEDYKSALQYADALQRTVYEDEAKVINEIQKGILEISAKEEPFDVFICYKETDANGRRTPDSVLATDLYHQLTNEGFKVFFSRITLEDKLGQEYEPYIFAALNSAKAMVVLGTKPEHFNAVWVKNEWSRYLALIKAGAKKTLIPAYRDMDPYDLPDEFSHLQAQDMSKLGFMQDLIRGIKKIVKTDESKQTTVRETIVQQGAQPHTAPLLKRAFMFLEDGEWQSADEYCEKVLDLDPENAEAYLGKLMAELKVKKREVLKDAALPFDDRNNYQKAVRFGDEKLKQKLSGDIDFINTRNEEARKTGIYNDGVKAMDAASTESAYKMAAATFKTIPGFKDADVLAERCLEQAEICRKDGIYQSARSQMSRGFVHNYESAITEFRKIPGWKDADALLLVCQRKIEEIKAKEEADRIERERKAEKARIAAEKRKKKVKITALIIAIAAAVTAAVLIVLFAVILPKLRYNKAVALYEAGQRKEAVAEFTALNGYKDSRRYIKEYWDPIAVRDTIAARGGRTVGLKSDGTVVAVGNNGDGQCDVSGWTDIVSIAAGFGHTVGLKSDGTVVAVGRNDHGQCNVSGWKNIVAIAAAGHTVGLRSDGTVVAVGYNDDGQCGVSGWTDIVSIAAGGGHTVGLKSDGTVVATKYTGEQLFNYGRCNVSGWTDIVAIAAGYAHTVGLRSDGTVVAVGYNGFGQCDVSGWRNIVAIAVGDEHTVGLRSDGTVVATKYKYMGDRYYGQCDVSDWKNIRIHNR